MKILYGGKSPLISKMEKHRHDTWEVLAILEGNGTIDFGGDVHPFDPYSIICIPPATDHREVSEGQYRDYWFHVEDFPFSENAEPILWQDDAGHTASSLMGLIYPLLHRKDKERIQPFLDTLTDALAELMLLRNEQRPVDIRVGQIVRFLTQNMSDPDLRIEDCLEAAGYCSDHMRRLFTKETGKTPGEYLCDLRLRAAKKLLALRCTTHSSVESIAEMCGFSDIAYFSRIFKKKVGLSPTAYAASVTALSAPAPEQA